MATGTGAHHMLLPINGCGCQILCVRSFQTMAVGGIMATNGGGVGLAAGCGVCGKLPLRSTLKCGSHDSILR